MQSVTSPIERRLSVLRNPWWFADHLHVRHLWRDLKATSVHASGTLLDLGCGNAPYKPWFEPRVEKYVTADFPPVSERVQVASDTEHLPFKGGSFETVLCTQVLEHIPRPWAAAAEIARVLKPGGKLILSCPQYWILHEIPHDYFRFTPYGLRVLFPDHDWEWVEHRQQGSTWAVIACAFWQSFRTFGRAKRLIALFANPVFILLDRLWGNPNDTTNHLIVLSRKPKPHAVST